MSEFTDGIRALADWFDAHPDVASLGDLHASAMVFLGAEHLPAVAKAMGHAEKRGTDYSFDLRRKFGEHVTLVATVSRSDLCERVQVGERTVTRYVPPAGVELTEVTETEPVYEWRCPESILRPTQEREELSRCQS